MPDAEKPAPRKRAKRAAAAVLDRGWCETNGFHLLDDGGFCLRVFEYDCAWHSIITRKSNGKEWRSKNHYADADAAKLGALHGLQYIKDKMYFT